MHGHLPLQNNWYDDWYILDLLTSLWGSSIPDTDKWPACRPDQPSAYDQKSITKKGSSFETAMPGQAADSTYDV